MIEDIQEKLNEKMIAVLAEIDKGNFGSPRRDSDVYLFHLPDEWRVRWAEIKKLQARRASAMSVVMAATLTGTVTREMNFNAYSMERRAAAMQELFFCDLDEHFEKARAAMLDEKADGVAIRDGFEVVEMHE